MVSLRYENVYIKDWFSIAGPDEANGNIKNINLYLKDYYYGEKTFEKAEIKMQKTVINNLLQKNEFDLIIGGDLSNQLGVMNMSLKETNKSFLGIYNACSTFNEGLILASLFVNSNKTNNVCVLTSSHMLTSERQFRFPNEYNSMKSQASTITATGAVGAIISNVPTNYKITSATIGSVVDYGIKDVSNMGAVMAPACASVIASHLYSLNKTLDDYNLILTGDLGKLGVQLLKKVLKSDHGIISDNIVDAGSILYTEEQNKFMGGSGPVCLPLVLFNKFLKNKKIKRILVVATGALHNPTLINQKTTIPAIAHAVEIEVL